MIDSIKAPVGGNNNNHQRYADIVGVGGYLPARCVDNHQLEQWVDTSDDWIQSRTGIRQRYLASVEELASDLALPASQQALSLAKLSANDLDFIIVATTTPDRIYPSTACFLQAKLSAMGGAFDVQAVCSGFVYALSLANSMIVSGMAQHILVVGAEIFSRLVDWQDRNTCVLFGDGAGAAVLSATNAPGIIATHLGADGRYANDLTVRARVGDGQLKGHAYTQMDGTLIFRFAVDKMSQSILEVVGDNHIDWLVLHQANKRIIEAVGRRLGVAEERILITVSEHGNTSAASIPLVLSAHADKFSPGDKIALAAVGGGLTWGAVFLSWSCEGMPSKIVQRGSND